MTRRLTWVRAGRLHVLQTLLRVTPRQGSQAVWVVQRARLFSVLTAGLLTRMLLNHYVLVGRAIIRALTMTCVAMPVQRARPFSVLRDGLLIRVLPNHCVLANRAIIRVLTTNCAVRSRTLIVLVPGLRVRRAANLLIRDNGISKRPPVATGLPALLVLRRVSPEMVTARSLCTSTAQAHGLNAPVRVRMHPLDSGHRRPRRVAMGSCAQLLHLVNLEKASVQVHARQ